MGVDDIADKSGQGIPVTVAKIYVMVVARRLKRCGSATRARREGPSLRVGHSSGATALPDMVDKIGTLGVPIKMADRSPDSCSAQAVG